MSDIINLLPPEARKHYINLRNLRDRTELEQYNDQLRSMKSEAAARGSVRSGAFMKQTSDLQKNFVDSTVHGFIEDALATCALYEIPLTKELCKGLEEAARGSLMAKYSRGPYIQPIGGHDWPAGATKQLKEEWDREKFKSLPKIAVMIETARVADERKRTEEMANKASRIPPYTPPKRFAIGERVRIINPGIDGVVIQVDDERTVMAQYWHTIETKHGNRKEPGSILELIPPPITSARSSGYTTNYIQHVNQSGPGSSVSQLGDTHTNILQVGDMSELKQELAAIRAALKAQSDSLEADEVLGSLASAEKAAHGNDEHGVKNALGKVTKGGWEIVKKVAPSVGSEVLLHYLKLHGMA
jgi:hypothetical protein